MIVFERTEGEILYDNVRLEIGGGYETTIDDYIHYFVVFLQALTFQRESIIQGLKDYQEEE